MPAATVGEGPEEVLADVAQGRAADLERHWHAGEGAGHEHEICGLHRHIGACAERDAHICLRQSGCVIDAITNETEGSKFALQAFDFIGFTAG
jgi:hypothetical protein